MGIISFILLILIIGAPCTTFLIHLLFKEKKEDAARLASFLIGLGFISSLLLFIKGLGTSSFYFFFLHLTTPNSLLCTLILFVSFIVHRFSIRYMAGDRFYRRYFFTLSAITLSAMSWVMVDNIFLFWIGWSLSNSCYALNLAAP